MGIKFPRSNKIVNEKISKYLEKEQQQKPCKLVLLGPEKAGKSTLFKQIENIFSDCFGSIGIRDKYKDSIHSNVIEGIKTLIEQAQIHGFEFSSQRIDAVNKIIELKLNSKLTEEIGELISDLWKNEQSIQKIYSLKSTYSLNDSVSYFLDNIDRITKSIYIPTKEDILRTYRKNSSITEILFRVSGSHFSLSDVGEQTGPLRKWMNCFGDVQAVIFVVAISEYDQQLLDKPEKNCLLNSIELFGNIANSSIYSKTPILLFLNKVDLFKEKLEAHQGDLKTIFPEYTGGYDLDQAINFLMKKFASVRENDQKEIYFQVTSALNQDNIRFSFRVVQDIANPRCDYDRSCVG